MYSVKFSGTKARSSLSLHYNGDNSYLFANGKEIIKFKAKDSEIVEDPICLGNISQDFSESNMKKTGCMVLFITLVVIIMLLQLMIY